MKQGGYDNNNQWQDAGMIGDSQKVTLAGGDDNNPMPIKNIDGSGRAAANTLFGDAIVASRHITLATQFQYGIEEGTALPEVVGSGNFAILGTLLKLNSGVDINGKVSIESTETVRYVPGTQVFGLFTAFFENSAIDSVQRGGMYDNDNGFFLEIRNDKAFFGRRRLGVDAFEEIDLAAFAAKEGYTIDLSKGNIFQISFVYLGFGPILLEIERPDGRMTLLHRIEYPNKFTETHIAQTYLPMRAEVFNDGNNTDVGMGIGSIAAGIVNGDSADAAKRTFSYSNPAPFTVNSNTTLVAFRNKDIFNGIANRIVARLILSSGANDLNKNTQWIIFRNPTFLNTPTFAPLNVNNSVMEVSIDAIVDFAASIDKFLVWNTRSIDSFFLEVKELQLDLPPEGIAAFGLSTTGIGEADLSIRWDELF